jgi:hypothetical protein
MFRRTSGDYARVLFCFAREAAGAVERPAFPAPSLFQGDTLDASLGHFAPREQGFMPP